MLLSPGTRLGPYEIQSAIGSGGMGEVYRARDTRLGRDVAIKILPERFAADPAAVARFEQEGRAVAALSHPNILAIHDVGSQDRVTYAVTELLDGDTLRDRLARGRLPLRKAVEYAVQIAQGLAAAHAKGITHRDIKPENVFVTVDGHVKILDFGLAKVQAPVVADLTTTAHLPTDPGTVLGTAGYLSPEQAQGRPVDHRSDIFSLGAVLYEMATGARAFKGDSTIDSLHKVIHSEPPPIDAAAPDAPGELRWVLAKCLAKDPDERYQSTRDLVVDLRNVARALESSPRLPVVDPTPATGWSRGRWIAAIAALVLVGTIVAVWWPRRGGSAGQADRGDGTLSIEPITTMGTVIDAVISPDGKYVAYVVSESGRQGLWLRQLATASTLELVPPAPVGYWGANFTPDGSAIYYATVSSEHPERALFRVPTLGGTSRQLLTGLDSFPVFSPDGRRIAYVRERFPEPGASSLMVADADGANARALTTRRLPEFFAPIFFTAPAWSPDGSVIVCPMKRSGGDRPIGMLVAVRTVDGSEAPFPRHEWPEIGQATWTRDGQGLIALGGADAGSRVANQLWWVSATSPERRRITNDLLDYRRVSMPDDESAIVTVTFDVTSSIWTTPLGSPGEPKRLSSGQYDGLAGVAGAPGGRILYRSLQSGSGNIWMMDEAGGARTQITTDGKNFFPAPAPDGRSIVFERQGSGLWWIGVDGQNPRAIPNTEGGQDPIVTPDGKWVIYSLTTAGVERLWKVPADGGGAPAQMIDAHSYRPAVSPDGTRVAFYYQERLDSPVVLAVMPLTGDRPTQTFGVNPSSYYSTVRWTIDGKALLHNSGAGDRANIWLQPLSGGPPRKVTQFVDQNILTFDRSTDGKSLILARGILKRDAVIIRNFR